MRIRFLFSLFLLAGFILPQSDFEQGVDWYNNRHAGSMDTKASPESINKAIEFFTTSLQSPEQEVESALYLLKCYYYKAEFAMQNKEDKKHKLHMKYMKINKK